MTNLWEFSRQKRSPGRPGDLYASLMSMQICLAVSQSPAAQASRNRNSGEGPIQAQIDQHPEAPYCIYGYICACMTNTLILSFTTFMSFVNSSGVLWLSLRKTIFGLVTSFSNTGTGKVILCSGGLW